MTITIQKFWHKQASTLPQMAQILSRELPRVCPDLSPLYQAASLCRTNLAKGKFFYVMDDLHFRIKSNGHIPNHAPQNVDIFLSVHAESNTEIKDYDPFNRLELNVILTAGADRAFLGAWHLDRHVGKEGEPSDSLHPLYHFHFGGHHLKELNNDVGRLLIMDGPRLPHFPMDIFLGVDFVLSHYVGDAWAKLKDNTTYLSFLRTSQEFLIGNHVRALYSYYGPTPYERKNGGACRLWPNLPPH